MADFEKLIERRTKLAKRKEGALVRNTKNLQRALFSLILDRIVLNLDTSEDGRLKFNSRNVGRVANSGGIWRSYRKASRGLGQWIVKGLLEVFDLNTVYFDTVAKVTTTKEERARNLLFKSLGYDVKKKEFIPNSWLDNLLSQEDVKRKVVDRLNSALRTRMSMDDFKKQFRDDFIDNKNGLGVVSKNMNFHARNIFQSVDRASQEVYREELKLNFALYSGTKQQPSKDSSGTRDFCWRRTGNLYDVETIESWNALEWQGKIPGSNVFLTLGGFSCRHHLSYLSDEAAQLMIKRGKELNKLSPPKPKRKK